MPTKKPIVQAVLEQNLYNDYMEICEMENRSISNLTQYVIRKYVEEYKSTHKKQELLDSNLESKRA